MGKKIGSLIVLWICIFAAYFLIAFIFPVFTTLTYQGQAATVAAAPNATARVGSVEFMGVMPLVIWFIPGGLGVLATIVYVKAPDVYGRIVGVA